MICFTTGRQNAECDAAIFRKFRFTGRYPRNDQGSNHPATNPKKETAMSQAKGSWMRMAVLAGVLAFSSDAAAQTAPLQTASPRPQNAAPTADNAVMLTCS
jgi:hypothetical protein